jgi:hypothetical protein
LKSANNDNIEEWLQSDACELGFQHDRHGHCDAAAKQKGEEADGEDESEGGGQSSECVSQCMVLQCADTLLDYMGQRGFEYSDITATRIICSTVRRSLNS